LGRYGSEADAARALQVLVELAPVDTNGLYASVLALNALDAMDERARPAADAIRALPMPDSSVSPRMRAYVPDLVLKTLADLE